MMVFNCFTDIVSSWFVGHTIQMPDVIRECFQQGRAEFMLCTQWYVQFLGGVSHSVFCNALLHLGFLAFLTPFFC